VQNAPWAVSDSNRLFGCYNEDTDLQARYHFHEIIEQILGGEWEPAWAPFEARRESMFSMFSRAQSFTPEPKLKISPNAALIAPALRRSCSPRDRTVYSAVANAVSLLINRLTPNHTDELPQKLKPNINFFARDRKTWAGRRR
jgi:hypothetical protein